VGLGALVLALGVLTTTRWALQTARDVADSFARDTRAKSDGERPAPELVAH
jgi:hypothetical protein